MEARYDKGPMWTRQVISCIDAIGCNVSSAVEINWRRHERAVDAALMCHRRLQLDRSRESPGGEGRRGPDYLTLGEQRMYGNVKVAP